MGFQNIEKWNQEQAWLDKHHFPNFLMVYGSYLFSPYHFFSLWPFLAPSRQNTPIHYGSLSLPLFPNFCLLPERERQRRGKGTTVVRPRLINGAPVPAPVSRLAVGHLRSRADGFLAGERASQPMRSTGGQKYCGISKVHRILDLLKDFFFQFCM